MIPLRALLTYAHHPDAERKRWEDLCRLSGGGDIRAFTVPGRVEIIGNHTDHNQGRVLAASVNLDLIAVAKRKADKSLTIHTNGKALHIPLSAKLPPQADPSEILVKTMVDIVSAGDAQVQPFELWIDSKVPLGQGLSSSAAYCMLILEVITKLSDISLGLIERAQIGQQAEHSIKKPCGLMDQLACAHGGIIRIDFDRPQEPLVQPVASDENLRFVIAYTGGSHENISHHYAKIPHDMHNVSSFFSKEYLRQVDEREFFNKLQSLRKQVSDIALMRAMHFFAENKRVDSLTEALKRSNYSDIFSNIEQSGDSSWKLLQNVIIEGQEEQGLAMGLAVSKLFCEQHGQGACRVHGGGFTGSILVLLPKNLVQSYIQYIETILGTGSATELSIRPTGAEEVRL